MARKSKLTVFDCINAAFLLLVSACMLYPFIYLFFISISPIQQVVKSGLLLLPHGIDLSSYQYVLGAVNIASAYKVTIFIAFCGTALSLLLTSLGAYVLSHRELPGHNILAAFLIITMVFNGGLIPLYLTVKSLHLIDSVFALFVPTAINTFWLFVMRNFFSSIPASLAESARIDGCSEYRILMSVILPVSVPILATLALFYGVGFWNQYFNAIIFINTSTKFPLQVIIRMMYQNFTAPPPTDALPPPVETIRAATIMIATLPILCVYPFLQRYFAKGLMVGAIKG
jgi:putative aldouronate transport system permease protein